MLVYFGKHKNWFGPYQLANALCFWVKEVEDEYGIKAKPQWVHKFGEWLAHGNIEPEREVGEVYSWSKDRDHTWLYSFLLWIDKLKDKFPREYVKIDRWDSWNVDSTLSPIILPLLKQLYATKHGSAHVDLEDVPEALRANSHSDFSDQKTFDFYHENSDNIDYEMVHKRWDWVLNEMIFAFDHLVDRTWEDKYHSGEHDITWTKMENGCSQMGHGPNDTYKCDYEGLQEEWNRVDNGLRLFGKYFRNLWD
jgi:hypothetical protein